MSQARPFVWGSLPGHEAMKLPCDRFVLGADHVLYRSVEVDVSPEILFAWLCQLRAAPYSYDWIDHLGRRSPPQLTPGLTELEIGQRVMYIFELMDFERNQNLTILMKPGSRAERVFGQVAVTYRILPQKDGTSRLMAKLRIRYPVGRWGRILRVLLPWGDLFMMRKQLLTLKHLAEQTR